MNPRLGVSSNLGPHEACFLDLATGIAQYRLSFVYNDGGHSYTTHVAAKDVVLLNQYQGTSTHETPYLNMAVVSMGQVPRVVARNGIPLTKAAPVCDRDRIYIRGERQVVCLGRVGDQGAAYERRTIARSRLHPG